MGVCGLGSVGVLSRGPMFEFSFGADIRPKVAWMSHLFVSIFKSGV